MDLTNELVRRGLHPDATRALWTSLPEVVAQLRAVVVQMNAVKLWIPICVNDTENALILWWGPSPYENVDFDLSLSFGSLSGSETVALAELLDPLPDVTLVRRLSGVVGGRTLAAPFHMIAMLPTLLDRLGDRCAGVPRVVAALRATQKDPR